MPHSVPPVLTSLTVGGTKRLVRCWKIELRFGGGMFLFTEADTPLQVTPTETYEPALGMDGASAESAANLSPSTTGARGILSSARLSETDLRAGRFNGAQVTEFVVDARYPWAGQTRVVRYDIGEVRWSSATQMFEASLVGLSERLRNRVGEVYGRACRFNLGDADCGVDLEAAANKLTTTVATVTSRMRFTLDTIAGFADTDFDAGTVVFASGDNAGLTFAIKRQVGVDVSLLFPLPRDLTIGDDVVLRRGCNKRFGFDLDGEPTDGHCVHKFDNGANFGGFPYLPTNDRLFLTPDAQR